MPMQQNLPKIAQIYPKTQFWFNSKPKISTCRRGTRACFHRLDFQSNNFSYAIFIVKKQPLYVNLFEQNDVFFKVPYASWI
jgi:hypothetical protein